MLRLLIAPGHWRERSEGIQAEAAIATRCGAWRAGAAAVG